MIQVWINNIIAMFIFLCIKRDCPEIRRHRNVLLFHVHLSWRGTLPHQKSDHRSVSNVPWQSPWDRRPGWPPAPRLRAHTGGLWCCPGDRTHPSHGYWGTRTPRTWGPEQSPSLRVGKFCSFDLLERETFEIIWHFKVHIVYISLTHLHERNIWITFLFGIHSF